MKGTTRSARAKAGKPLSGIPGDRLTTPVTDAPEDVALAEAIAKFPVVTIDLRASAREKVEARLAEKVSELEAKRPELETARDAADAAAAETGKVESALFELFEAKPEGSPEQKQAQGEWKKAAKANEVAVRTAFQTFDALKRLDEQIVALQSEASVEAAVEQEERLSALHQTAKERKSSMATTATEKPSKTRTKREPNPYGVPTKKPSQPARTYMVAEPKKSDVAKAVTSKNVAEAVASAKLVPSAELIEALETEASS